MQEQDLIRDALGLAQVVGRHDHLGSGPVHRLDQGFDRRGGSRIQIGSRFVQQQYLRPHRPGPGDGQPLLLAAGEHPCRPIGQFGQSGKLQGLGHALRTLPPWHGLYREHIGDVRRHRAPQQHRPLKHHRLPFPGHLWPQSGPVYAPGGGREQPVAKPQQQALAGAVRAQHHGARPVAQRERPAIDKSAAVDLEFEVGRRHRQDRRYVDRVGIADGLVGHIVGPAGLLPGLAVQTRFPFLAGGAGNGGRSCASRAERARRSEGGDNRDPFGRQWRPMTNLDTMPRPLPLLPPAYRLVQLVSDDVPFDAACASASSGQDGDFFWSDRHDRLDCAILLHPELPASRAGLIAHTAMVGIGDAIGGHGPAGDRRGIRLAGPFVCQWRPGRRHSHRHSQSGGGRSRPDLAGARHHRRDPWRPGRPVARIAARRDHALRRGGGGHHGGIAGRKPLPPSPGLGASLARRRFLRRSRNPGSAGRSDIGRRIAWDLPRRIRFRAASSAWTKRVACCWPEPGPTSRPSPWGRPCGNPVGRSRSCDAVSEDHPARPVRLAGLRAGRRAGRMGHLRRLCVRRCRS